MASANFSMVESAEVVITGRGIKIVLTVGKKKKKLGRAGFTKVEESTKRHLLVPLSQESILTSFCITG